MTYLTVRVVIFCKRQGVVWKVDVSLLRKKLRWQGLVCHPVLCKNRKNTFSKNYLQRELCTDCHRKEKKKCNAGNETEKHAISGICVGCCFIKILYWKKWAFLLFYVDVVIVNSMKCYLYVIWDTAVYFTTQYFSCLIGSHPCSSVQF